MSPPSHHKSRYHSATDMGTSRTPQTTRAREHSQMILHEFAQHRDSYPPQLSEQCGYFFFSYSSVSCGGHAHTCETHTHDCRGHTFRANNGEESRAGRHCHTHNFRDTRTHDLSPCRAHTCQKIVGLSEQSSAPCHRMWPRTDDSVKSSSRKDRGPRGHRRQAYAARQEALSGLHSSRSH